MKLLHGADHVIHMFDDVNRRETVERTIGEGIRKAVEIGEDVGAAVGIPVEPDGSGLLVDPAADVENLHITSRRHASRVSSAKSHWSRVTMSGGQRRIVL